MKVNILSYNAVAAWRWDMPEDDDCGICRVQFDGTCPKCKFPGDDCPISMCCVLDESFAFHSSKDSNGTVYTLVPHVFRIKGTADQSEAQPEQTPES
ncbi:hypothetical protein E4T42_07072 [Aureobasidium subglaciale]|nr:hypothetical protein E4T42_07072 [Aureobasidium subglaciale]